MSDVTVLKTKVYLLFIKLHKWAKKVKVLIQNGKIWLV